MAKAYITAERLRSILDYDHLTGVFRWRLSVGRVRAGDIAGHMSKKSGYWLIKISQFKYMAHRLAWLYMTGEHPVNEIDHRDKKRSNNAWKNLRAATRKQNQENKCDHQLRGIRWEEDRGKWMARIKHNGKAFNLGRFNELQDAISARRSAEIRLFTHSAACEPQPACLDKVYAHETEETSLSP